MKAVVLVLGAVVVACSPAPAPSPRPVATELATPRAPIASPSAGGSGLPLADASPCAPTRPGKAPAEIGDRMFGSDSAVGNDALWVGGLGPDGVIAADPGMIESDGSISWKLGWWRFTPGSLSITGIRLDETAPALRASVPEGYGQEGFQSSGLSFPTEGCWEVSGTVAGYTLTFVAFVIRA
jgi:hypothetical protein